jgi:AraC-like DNA-binding protein
MGTVEEREAPLRRSQIPTVQSLWARSIAEDLHKFGRSVDAVLAEAGLSLRAINRGGGRVPWLAQARLLEITARELADDCYGIHLASRVDAQDFGVLAYVGLMSRTFGEALNNLSRYSRVFNDALRIDLSTRDGMTIVGITSADPSLFHYRQQMEFAVGATVNAYRLFTKQQVTPVEVRFVHARSDGMTEISRRLGCEVSFRQSQVELVFKASDMAILIPAADHRLHKVLQTHGDSIIEQHGTRDIGLVHEVERRIVQLLPTGAAKAEVIAAELGMSQRTLTRQLTAYGTNFNDVLERMRKQLALSYVRGGDVRLTEISFLLGYANQPAFNQAFKRWTGMTPRALSPIKKSVPRPAAEGGLSNSPLGHRSN